MYKRILAVLGDDLQGDIPVEYAMTLATSTGAELSLLQVLTMPIFVCGLDTAWCSPLCLNDIEEASDAVLTHAIATAETYGVSYTAMLRWRAISNTILHTAEEADCDLIVVGAPSYPGWPRFQGTYIAKKMVAQAQQPVLLVGSAPSYLPDTVHWSRVLVVTDGVPSTVGAVEYALTLAQTHALDVGLLHPDTALRLPPVTRASGVLTRVAAYATAAGVHDAMQRGAGNMANAIVATATQRECEAIILGRHRTSGWKRRLSDGVVRRVIAESPLPVLLVNRALVSFV